MKYEVVNENTIRVFITQEDLIAHNIEHLNLMGDQEEVEDFFFEILDEVNAREYFGETDMLTFQARPRGNKLELLITKANFSNAELKEKLGNMPRGIISPMDLMESSLQELFELSEQSKVGKTVEEASLFVDGEASWMIRFATFEEVIALAKDFKFSLKRMKNELYQIEDAYFLVVRYKETKNQERIDIMFDELSWLSEYGEILPIHVDLLNEYANVMFKKDALQNINQIFK